MTVSIIQGNARALPLADNTVDLVVTSPPYFALRSYQDGGEHYDGQIGSEPTPAEFVAALLDVTRECVRVLKPSGSLWVNLGDKYAGSAPGRRDGGENGLQALDRKHGRTANSEYGDRGGTPDGWSANWGQVRPKSLIGIPWRYALACIDDLGLILRAEVIWSKPNGLPESVTDRVRRSHEQWFHFTLEPRYYSAVDEIREAYNPVSVARAGRARVTPIDAPGQTPQRRAETPPNPLGALPGSVWTIKEEIWDHVLSGPMHFCPRCGRDLTAGPSPATMTPKATPPSTSQELANDGLHDSSTPSLSDPSQTDSPSTTSAGTRDASTPTTSSPSPSKRTYDGETKPTAAPTAQRDTHTTNSTPTSGATESASAACVCETGLPPIDNGSVWVVPTEPLTVPAELGVDHFAAFPTEWPRRIIQGWSPAGVCVECGEGRRPVTIQTPRLDVAPAGPKHMIRYSAKSGLGTADLHTITGYACACPEPTAPTTPGVILDPFGGTGTTALVADVLGRHGISVDMSADYCRLARWRTTDPGQRAKAARVEKPPVESVGQLDLFDMEAPA